MRISCATAAASGARSGLTTSWTTAGVVAQVDEDEAAVVAARVDPAGERDALARRRSARSSPHVVSRQLLTASSCRARRARFESCSPRRRSVPAVARRGSRRARRARLRLRELTLDRAAGVVGVDARRRARAAREQRRAASRAVRRSSSTRKTSSCGASAAMPSSSSDEHEPLDARAEADARRRRAADLLDEVVVAAAAADRRCLRRSRPGR